MAYPKHINIRWNDVPYKERPQELAGIISEFVNGASSDYTSVADELARDHRYLQGEEFKVRRVRPPPVVGVGRWVI